MTKTKIIIDSQLPASEAIAVNPDNLCPSEILQNLGLMEITYIGFDNNLHKGQIVVATEVMAEVEAFFKNALEIMFPIEKVIPAAAHPYRWDDQKLMADNVTSGFNYRVIAGMNRLSNHGLGRAFDVNTRLNPCIRYEKGKGIVKPPKSKWDKNILGTLHGEHALVKLMEGFGWEWGGRWTAKKDGIVDYQHFQKPL